MTEQPKPQKCLCCDEKDLAKLTQHHIVPVRAIIRSGTLDFKGFKLQEIFAVMCHPHHQLYERSTEDIAKVLFAADPSFQATYDHVQFLLSCYGAREFEDLWINHFSEWQFEYTRRVWTREDHECLPKRRKLTPGHCRKRIKTQTRRREEYFVKRYRKVHGL